MKKGNKVNEKVTIMIIPAPGIPEQDGIYVSVNEKTVMIQPGHEVRVDEDTYDALMNSRYGQMVIRR